MADAFTELGVAHLREHAMGNAVGQFWAPATIDAKTMTRSSSLTAYYDKASWRPNLKMLTEHKVTQLTFKGASTTVSGVKAINRKTNKEVTFHARKEVILAAGSLHTPQILQLSGIGPKCVVEAAGIKSRVDLPGVGSNLQDHPVAYLNWKVTNSFPEPNIMMTNETFAAEALAEYQAHRTGPYTKAQSNTIAFLSLPMVTNNTEDMINSLKQQVASKYLPGVYSRELISGYEAQRAILAKQLGEGSVSALEFPFGGSGMVPNSVQKPLSRGTVHLNPDDPHGEPIVTYNAFTNPFDRAQLASFIAFTRRYFKTNALADMQPQEVSPGEDAQTEDEIIAKLAAGGPLSLSPSFAHPSSSCPMMPKNKGGCVSADLRVHGTRKLSIIDASILPIIPSAHLQATIGEVFGRDGDDGPPLAHQDVEEQICSTDTQHNLPRELRCTGQGKEWGTRPTISPDELQNSFLAPNAEKPLSPRIDVAGKLEVGVRLGNSISPAAKRQALRPDARSTDSDGACV
ncbi:choline dehydrogenase [Histoplasma capsulatum]|uniref:Choline dehydrogenase n=1 Tax=Ajellomyces capsulatus TaxID=5037 RepID=A0A8A1LYV1_AJECA|nr:choline dehydrogenase [Histoplasma capsulatum]